MLIGHQPLYLVVEAILEGPYDLICITQLL